MRGSQREVVGALWDRLWTGGLTQPSVAIEQISYLLLLKRLDCHPFPESSRRYTRLPDVSWKIVQKKDPRQRLKALDRFLIEFLKQAIDSRRFDEAMRGASFNLWTAEMLRDCMALLDRLGLEDEEAGFAGEVLNVLIDQVDFTDKDGHFVTPRPLARAMAELVRPEQGEVVVDPAVGTGGFLVEALRMMRSLDEGPATQSALFGYDADPVMVRIAVMNLVLHGSFDPEVELMDSLRSPIDPLADVVLCNPPFNTTVGSDSLADALVLDTKRTDLLFMERCRRLLKPGGRLAILVPQGVLYGSSEAHVKVRKRWLTEAKVEAIISLPPDVFEPGADLRTAIVLASAHDGTDGVLFCPFSDEEVEPEVGLRKLAGAVHAALAGRLPDDPVQQKIAESSWLVPLEQIADREYDLLPSTHQEMKLPKLREADPLDLLAEARRVEANLQEHLAEATRLLSDHGRPR